MIPELVRQYAIVHFAELGNDNKCKGQYISHDQIAILATKFDQKIEALTSELKLIKDQSSDKTQNGKRKEESRKGLDAITS